MSCALVFSFKRNPRLLTILKFPGVCDMADVVLFFLSLSLTQNSPKEKSMDLFISVKVTIKSYLLLELEVNVVFLHNTKG